MTPGNEGKIPVSFYRAGHVRAMKAIKGNQGSRVCL